MHYEDLIFLNYQDKQTSLSEYVTSTFKPQDTVLEYIKQSSAEHGLPEIHVRPLDGQILEILTFSLQPKRAVEIGTLGGYSSTCLARGLAPEGHLFTFEADTKHAELAQKHFAKLELENKITVITGDANETLKTIESEGPFDLVFIDAEKSAYPNYLHWCFTHLKAGGVLLADNTLGFGETTVIDEHLDDKHQKQVEAIRRFNETLAKSAYFKTTLLPTTEGMTFAVKTKEPYSS